MCSVLESTLIQLLGTHDIQNISVTSQRSGEVRVTGDLVDGSTADGVLVVVSNGSNSHYHVISSERDRPQVEDNISGLFHGQYSVSLFVVEKDGLPFTRVATRPRVVTVINSM